MRFSREELDPALGLLGDVVPEGVRVLDLPPEVL
jgi:hypothetical protein